MAKNKRLRGKVDKSASPAVVRQRSREQQYAEGKAIRYTCPRVMVRYAEYRGWAFARAGQPSLIAGYLGKGNEFGEALADFANVYARQNERDYEAQVRAVRQGRIEVYTES